MLLSSWQINKIETMVRYKETIADLYSTFSEIFPDYQYFFLTIALKHVHQKDWLKSCVVNIENGTYKYNNLRFKIEAIKTGLNFIESQLQIFKENTPTLRTVVSTAMAIETSLISNRFFEIIEPNTSELNMLFNYFKSEQRENINKLRNISRYKKSKLSYKFCAFNTQFLPLARDCKGVA